MLVLPRSNIAAPAFQLRAMTVTASQVARTNNTSSDTASMIQTLRGMRLVREMRFPASAKVCICLLDVGGCRHGARVHATLKCE